MSKTFIKRQAGIVVKAIFSFLVIFMFCDNIKSQTTLNSNLYFINKYQFNPAYAGSEGAIYSILDYRSTNSYSQSAPTSFNLAIHLPVFNKMGAGIRLSNNREGLFNNTNIFVDYSYKVNFKSKHNIIFGVSAGLELNQMDFSKIIAEDPAAIIEVASKNYVGSSFETSAGIAYNWRNLDISVSIPQLFENKNIIGFSYLSLVTYNLKLKEQEINIKPSVFFIKNPSSTAQYNINLQTIWKNQFWIGISYKNRPAFVFSAGANLNNINIAYAIELGAEKHSNIFKKIHEISIAYNFKRNKKLPNDSLFVDNDFVLKTDTTDTKIDSSEITEKLIIEKNNVTDSLLNKKNIDENIYTTNNNQIKLTEIADGIYILKNTVSDSSDVINSINDSLLLNSVVKEINNNEKDSLEYVEVSPSIYRIKNIKTNKFINLGKDSISNSRLDSLSIKNKGNKFNSTTEKKKYHYNHYVYYTIRLYINDTDKHLLYKPEIVENTRAETDSSGIRKYYYGQFSSMKEATKHLLKLKKLGIKTLKIKKVSSFQ